MGSLHPVGRKDHAKRVSNYVQYERDGYVRTRSTFQQPYTAISQIPKFKKSNSISINVFGLENKEVYPLQRISDGVNGSYNV